MTLIVTPLLVLCLSDLKFNGEINIAVALRHYSAGMYFAHKAVRSIIEDIVALTTLKLSVVILFILVYLISAILCFGAYQSNNKKIKQLFM